MNSYIVATIKSWNIKNFREIISKYPGKWHLISDPKKLTLKALDKIKPRYVFFPHWSVKVPKQITDKYECVCFHETDLPYGRGGTPIQNLILAGKKKSKITALRMVEELDAGPIYLKKPVSLHGSAQEIYERSSLIVAEMIKDIVIKNPKPRPQKGKITVFKRRTPDQSDLTKNSFKSDEEFYDFVRMLDAESYPKAFIPIGEKRIEFFDVRKKNGKMTCNLKIT